MKTIIVALASVAALGACVDQFEDADESELAEVESGVFTDLNRNTQGAQVRIKSMSRNLDGSDPNLCMDVAGGNPTTGTPIVQFPCHPDQLNSRAQRFFLASVTLANTTFQIQSRVDTAKCVGVGANDRLILTPCEVAGVVPEATKFRIDSSDLTAVVSHGRLRSVGAVNKCVDVPNGSKAQSLMLQVYACHTGANQQWELSNR